MTSTATRPDAPPPGARPPAGSPDRVRPPHPGRWRFRGLLPNRLTRYRRPRWWQEIAIIAIGYYLYSLARNAIPGQAAIGYRHGIAVQRLQDSLHLNFELSVNHFVAAHEWLAQTMDYYYATLHFVITIGVLVWLFVARPQVYRGLRTVLFITTLLALIGFATYPLAPPRLLTQYHYIDTVLVFHTWGSLADPNVAAHSNQFAAMPSLHIGWSTWAGLSLAFCAKRVWVRALGVLYPIATFAVIVGTANHFIIDAVFGLVIVALGVLGQYALSGHRALTAPAGAPTEARRRWVRRNQLVSTGLDSAGLDSA